MRRLLPALALLAACGPAEPAGPTTEESAACCECLAGMPTGAYLLVEGDDGSWSMDGTTGRDTGLCVDHIRDGEIVADTQWWSEGESRRLDAQRECLAECATSADVLALATYRHCVGGGLDEELCSRNSECFAEGIPLDECR